MISASNIGKGVFIGGLCLLVFTPVLVHLARLI